jgi:hypothetical protein
LLAVTCGVAEAAPVDPAQFAAVDKAADAFVKLGKDAYKTGKPPRQSDPQAAKLLDTIFGTAKLNDGPGPVPFAQLDKLNGWLWCVLQTGAIYVLAGTGVDDINKASSADEKQIGLNLVAFAPEIGRYYDAQLAVSRAETDTIVAELAAHPDQFTTSKAVHGLATTRGGLTQTLIGVVTTFPFTGLDPAWIRDREVALMAIAPSAVKFLEADSRKQIADAALQVAEGMTDPAAKDGLIAFAKAIGP